MWIFVNGNCQKYCWYVEMYMGIGTHWPSHWQCGKNGVKSQSLGAGVKYWGRAGRGVGNDSNSCSYQRLFNNISRTETPLYKEDGTIIWLRCDSFFALDTHFLLTPLLPHTVVTQTQHQYTISTPKFIESYQLARATIYAALVRGYSKNFWVTVMLKWVERKTLKKPLVSRWYSVSIRWRWWRSWVWHTRVSSPLCATTNLEQTSHQPSHHNNQIFLVVEFCSEYWF